MSENRKVLIAISKDGVRKVLTKPDDPDEVAQNIGVVVIRANMKSKVFYLKKYNEGDSDGARPDCYSYDGEAPSANSPTPQAKKCAICPHNVWGSRVGDGDRGACRVGDPRDRALGDAIIPAPALTRA